MGEYEHVELTAEQRAEHERINTPQPWSPEKKRFAWIMTALGALIVAVIVAVVIIVNLFAQQAHQAKVSDCEAKYSPSDTAFYLCIDQ